MKLLPFVLIALVMGGLGFVTGRAVAPGRAAPSESAEAASERDASESPQVVESQVERLRAEIEELEKSLDERDELVRQFEEQNQQLKEEAQSREAQAQEALSQLAVEFGPHSELKELKDSDWEKASAAARNILAKMGKIQEVLAAGEDLADQTDLILEIQNYNQDLVKYAFQLQGKLPSYAGTVNGAYTHPLAVSNLMDRVLADSGVPLTAEQRASFERFGEAFEANITEATATYDESTLFLSQLLDEAEFKQDFVSRASDSLSANQREAVYPDGIEGRAMLDLFSPALMLIGHAQPQSFESRQQLRQQMMEKTAAAIGVDVNTLSADSQAFEQWEEQVSTMLTTVKPSESMYYDVEAALQAGRAQRDLYERLASTLNLTEEQRAQLVQSRTFVVPSILKSE